MNYFHWIEFYFLSVQKSEKGKKTLKKNIVSLKNFKCSSKKTLIELLR